MNRRQQERVEFLKKELTLAEKEERELDQTMIEKGARAKVLRAKSSRRRLVAADLREEAAEMEAESDGLYVVAKRAAYRSSQCRRRILQMNDEINSTLNS